MIDGLEPVERELRRFLRTQFRRIDVHEAACQVYALGSDAGTEPVTADDGLPVPPPEMVALVAGWIQQDAVLFRKPR